MDEIFMLTALAQSKKALPECLPNPPVGCVIVDAEEIVAQGYTRIPGKHHAEADALSQIQGQAFDFLTNISLEETKLPKNFWRCNYAVF